MEPTDGFLDPAMQETFVLLHETEGSEERAKQQQQREHGQTAKDNQGSTRTTDCKQLVCCTAFATFRNCVLGGLQLRPPLYSGGRNAWASLKSQF